MIENKELRVVTKVELKEILQLHTKWLNNEDGGIRADLRLTDLSSVDLSSSDLRSADLRWANLGSANLSWADLSSADLRWANLRDADLCSADLYSANLCWANLQSADLYSANLRYADLRSANLHLADLRWTDLHSVVGEMKSIKSFQLGKYMVSYTNSMLYIGCESYYIEEWKNFDDETIKNMDDGILEWWTKWKPIIFQIIEASPAEPTGYIGDIDKNKFQ